MAQHDDVENAPTEPRPGGTSGWQTGPDVEEGASRGRKGRGKRPRRKNRRKVLVVLGILLALLLIPLLVLGGFLIKLGHDFDSGTQKIENAMPEEDYAGRPSDDGSYNVLMLGSDSRAGEADAATVSGQRSDAIMLLHVPADGGEAYVISIMRDTWVDIPGHGQAKINAALDYGGVALEIQTIEQLLDTRIDHVASIDFEGFRDLTDAVGGVTVDVPMDFSTNEGVAFHQGEQTLNGEEALAFVRERYSFEDGDYQRVRDQRIYLRGLLKKIMSADTLSSPSRINDVVTKFSPYVSVDDDLSATEVARIGMKIGPDGFRNLTMFTLPNSGTGWSADGQSIVVADDDAIQRLSQAMKDGTMKDYAKTVDTDG